ncbi:hypothetical protein Noda2021_12470 [Candidatus Dependentiae bacterium Noda2021]|nr:hypothetical protein Noda2021_12470 [Candidatus Dependentiae bacterium Noda2021]
MKKIVIMSIVFASLAARSLFAMSQEKIDNLIKPVLNKESLETHVVKKLERVLKNQEEIKKNQKELLLLAKLPREQHTHYGFLSPHPLTALIITGVPTVAVLLVVAMMKS